MLRHPAPASVRGVVEVKAGGVLSRRVRRLALLKSAVLELRTRENGVVVHRVCVIDAEIDARRSSLQIVIRSGDTRVRLYLPSESRFDVWLRSLRSSSRWKVHNFYTLGEVIATGQFARVHTAVERVSADVVAVKVISKPKLDANPRVSQFISREARVCRSVEHSSIARVHDVFETPDALYIVMDHYGYTLFDVMASTHVLKESDAARILRDILKGLLYLHQRKIMHRDIKPDNILCSHPLPPLTVAICDFGLSNFTDAHVRTRRARRLPVPTHVNEVMHGHSTGALRARRNTLSPLVRPRSASSDSSGSSASSHAALLREHAENEDDVALRRVRAAAAARARSGLSASTSVAAAAGDVQSQSFSFGAFARLRARARAARRDGRHASSLSASGKRLQHYKDEHSWASGGGRTFASTTEAESSERADSDGLAMQWGMRGGAGAGGMGPGAQATTAGGVGGVMSKEPPSRRERMLEASAYNLDAALFPCAIDGFTLTSAIGTPSYVAPEIVERERYGPPVDVWGAGILLHLMLCGKVPFSGRDSSETLESIRVGKLDLDTDAWADVSAPARNLVAAMLQKDPRKRITVEAALAHAWINDPPNVERAMHPKFVHSPLVGNMHEREI